MNLRTFKKKLRAIKELGYIKTLRTGNTGVGHTLEQLLGLNENNIAIPDLGGKIELKSQRKSVTNRITILTKSPKWRMSPSKIISMYGYKNGGGRLALKITLTGKKEVKGLRLYFNKKAKTIDVLNNKSEVLAFWQAKELSNNFDVKLPKLIIVKATSKNRGKNEEFFYDEAYLLSDPYPQGFMKAIEEETMVIELRMHLRKTNNSIRDHGTAFRIAKNKIDKLYRNKKSLI